MKRGLAKVNNQKVAIGPKEVGHSCCTVLVLPIWPAMSVSQIANVKADF